MNRKFIVSFETAKKLKDAGCDCVTNFYYRSDGNFEIGIEVNNNILQEGNIAAPAYCELLDWFDRNGIFITTRLVGKVSSYTCTIRYFIDGHAYDIETMKYVNREDALEEAAKTALRVLTVKKV